MLLVVSLLEENVSADARLVKHPILLDGGCSDVHIDTTDSSVLMMYGVDRLDRLKDIFDRVVAWVFASLEGETLVPHVLQCDHLLSYLLLRQLVTGNGAVLSVVRTIDTTIDTVVGEVERSKEDNALTVEA